MKNIIHTDPFTLCTQVGRTPADGDPLVSPLVQSTTYCRGGINSQAQHAYSRVSNPSVSALEQALGDFEHAPPAVAFGSGLGAESALFLGLLKAGDHVLCGQHVYGGTSRLLRDLLSSFGIESTFADSTDLDAFADAIRPHTKLVFIETPANPTLEVSDIEAIARIAHAGGALLAVDNTFLTGVLQKPLEHDADITVYSTTKFIDGHSTSLGGAIVTRNESILERLRFIRKCTGGIQAPFNAWLTLQGIRTLALRLERQSASAASIADWLVEQPAIDRVYYPTYATPDQQQAARRQHPTSNGAVVSFELAGGLDAAAAFLSELRLCRLVEHVGSVETLVTHSASMTHADVPRSERLKAGVSDGLVRISVGLEAPEAIIRDLERALQAATRAVAAEEGAPCAVAR